MFSYHEPPNYWQRENLTYVPSHGGLGGGQAQHTQSINGEEQPLMSGNLSKFHLRHKQSVEIKVLNQNLCSTAQCSSAGGTSVLTICR